MKYLFVFIPPIINFFLLELYFFRPKLFFLSLGLVIINIIFTTIKVSGMKITTMKLWNLAILPMLFLSSLMLYSTLLTNKIFIQILFILTILFTYYYYKNIHFSYGKEANNTFFENISSYGNFLIIFFVSAGSYGLKSFLNTPIWMLMVLFVFVIILVVYESLFFNKISFEIGGVYIFLISLILIQIAWSIYFLPLNYNVLGLVLSICYYMTNGVIKYFLRNNLNKKIIKFYLLFGFGSIFLVLASARW